MGIADFIHTLIVRGFESFGKYYSTYRGLVVDIEDPNNLGRVLVTVPKVSGNIIHPIWAYPTGMMSGKDYGVNIPIIIGDIVWVEFEFGDPEYPVWSHGHYASGERPIEFTNTNYGIKTPGGNLILVDDKEDYIIFKKKGGLEVKLDKDNKVSILNNDVNFKEQMDKLIDAINNIVLETNYGPTIKTPVNTQDFINVKDNLNKLLS
jgi:hypothetical protein